MKKTLGIIVAAVFIASACGAGVEKAKTEKKEAPKKTEVEKTPKPTPEKGGTLALNGTGERATHVCNETEVSLDEESTSNTYTLTGECKKLIVDGVSNKVFVDKVGEIVVKGTSNKVFYGSGLKGGKPKISKNGTSLEVKKKLTEADVEKMQKEDKKK